MNSNYADPPAESSQGTEGRKREVFYVNSSARFGTKTFRLVCQSSFHEKLCENNLIQSYFNLEVLNDLKVKQGRAKAERIEI